MHALIVISHPNRSSLTHALAEQFARGIESRGGSFEYADLHAEGFNPLWSEADADQFETNVVPPDILSEQRRIARADEICLAFPLFWFSMPAMMKGWMDRVWTYGWAYDQVNDPTMSLQRARRGVMLVPAGGNPQKWAQFGFDPAMRTLWQEGMLGYFGMLEGEIHILAGSEGSDARRAELLKQAFEVGATLR